MGFVVGWTANGSSALLMFGGWPCVRSHSLLLFLLPLGLVCLCLVPKDSQIGFLWERTQITPVWTRGTARELSPQGSTSPGWFHIAHSCDLIREYSLWRKTGKRRRRKKIKKYLDDDIWSNPQRSPFLILLFLKVTLDFFLRTLDQRDFQSNLAVFVCLFVCCTVFPNLDVDISRFFWHVALFSVSERKR